MAHIMVVEDEPITAADLEQTILGMGHELSAWADTGEEAVEQAKKLSPDLVLMDIRLRGRMTGIEAAERIRRDSDVPVVFLTAFADRDTVDRACETHPYGYLVKPFTERTVAAAVQAALARVDAERKNLERERWVSSVLRSMGEAIVAIDECRAIRFVNALAEELLGVSERELLGRHVTEVIRISDPDRPGSEGPLEMALSEHRVTSSPGGALLARGDGKEVPITYSAAPVLGHRGTHPGAVLVFREARKGDEPAALAGGDGSSALRRRLQHEINSPLTYNLGALSLARSELDALRAVGVLDLASGEAEASAREREERLERLDRLIRTAHEGATRVASVMAELRTSSILGHGQTPITPEEILDLAVGSCGSTLENVRLTRQAGPAPLVLGNRWQLARVLADEMKDAIERDVANVGALVLETGTDDRGSAYVRIRVRRAGPAPGVRLHEDRSAAFAPTGAHEEDPIAAHGARLSVRDEDEVRTIELSLPPVTERAKEPLGGLEAEGAVRRGNVLVVDDEPMIGRVLEITLQQEHDVTAVESAESALALLERGELFDVILCDLSMPGMTGRELVEQLRATRPDVADRVVIMSGGARNAEDERFLASMVSRRLDKPFRTDELAPLIAEQVQARDRERSAS